VAQEPPAPVSMIRGSVSILFDASHEIDT